MALNTPHARRHLPRLLRRGFTTYASGTGTGPGMGLSITDRDGSTRDYVGTPAQAIALAAGRHARTGGGWMGAFFPSSTSVGMTEAEQSAYRKWRTASDAVSASEQNSEERHALIPLLIAAENHVRAVDTGATALLAMCGLD